MQGLGRVPVFDYLSVACMTLSAAQQGRLLSPALLQAWPLHLCML